MDSLPEKSPSRELVASSLPPVSPDFVEAEFEEQIDNIVPSRGYQMTPMVGIGGSAGSIAVLGSFFKSMPINTGMVFVVIMHLSPTHESALAELLGRSTAMPVVQAEDGQKVESNHVYVIPPGKYLAAVNGHLKLTELESERGKRIAVDLFFRSLADTHGPHAAAVILSGADGDGAIGIKRIKERGGVTIAQDPDQAEYPEMPRAAINTGMVDWVLEVEQMAKRLLDYRSNEFRIRLPPENGPPIPAPARAKADDAETALRDVLIFLRTRTGRDFSYYKRATILRRIGRRMQVNGVEDLPSYLSFLRLHPGEAGALLQDLLISVTNFFRGRDAFGALDQQLRQLFANKLQNDTIRVWVPACATGEEAYSMAILLLEHANKMDVPPDLQVFACDLDDTAIRAARMGNYPAAIAADVSEERLKRFFVKNHNGYQVRRELREMILFASHDLLKDAPFSRMDLVSCRNLLIYLNRDAQERAFETFHFALKPDGLLFLGSSEGIDDDSSLFQVRDKKHRLYVRRENGRIGLPIPSGSSSLLRAIEAQEHAAENAPVVHGKRFLQHTAFALPDRLRQHFDRAHLADLHFRLLERLAPPSVIVNADYDVVHLSENAGRFVQLSGGEPTTNLLRLVSPDLRAELRAALFRATESNAPAESAEVPSTLAGQPCTIVVQVSPAVEFAPGYLLVVFNSRTESRAEAPFGQGTATAVPPEPVLRHLERELEHVKSQLRETVEQYEASTEELKASNEELQAMNEELRSATEELETSREELQSINEELSTVNLEMKGKVDELAHANSDLQNLMASTAIATVFLDRELSITRYTPAASAIFNLIPGDVGRPLAHLHHSLEYPELIADAKKVLQTLVPIEREVRGDNRWFLARVQPYRTLEDKIAGAVLTLVDVTDRLRATEALRESEERMRLLIESAKDLAIFTVDHDRKVASWNSGAKNLFGYDESEILGQSYDILFTPEDRVARVPEQELQQALKVDRPESERWQMRKDGSLFYASGSTTPLDDKANGGVRGFVKIIRDLTEVKRNQEALRAHIDELTRFSSAAVGRESRVMELKKEVNKLLVQLGKPPQYNFAAEPEEFGNANA